MLHLNIGVFRVGVGVPLYSTISIIRTPPKKKGIVLVITDAPILDPEPLPGPVSGSMEDKLKA